MTTQQNLFKNATLQHGGSLAVGRRRSRRPLNSKKSLHIVLKSNHAIGGRCLFRHKKMILFVMRKACSLFRVKVYNFAIAGNHIHLLVKGSSREDVQNFFRVLAGHSAQNILKLYPMKKRGGAPDLKPGCEKNRRKFWSYLIYSRVISWGREFQVVSKYIQQNLLESLGLIAFHRQPVRHQQAPNFSRDTS